MISPAELPALKGMPILGSILEYRRDFLGLLKQVAAVDDLATFKILGEQLILVNSPELLHELLITHGHKLNKSEDSLDASRPLAGHGLFNIEEKYHKQDRKLLAADFTPRAVTHYGNLINECVDDQINEWTDGQEILVGKAMVQLTVRIIGKIALGVDLLHESENLWKVFTVAFERMRDYMAELVPLPLSFPTPSHLAYKRAVEELDKLIYQIIDQHKRGENDSDDVVNRLLRVQRDGGTDLEMTDQQVRDEVVTMLVAGHETTANALSFVWGNLVNNPEVYDKAREEVDRVLEGRAPTPDDLKNLPYIGQLFHESLRKYPPFYILDRQNMEPITLGNCAIPADSIILFSPYTMHRREDIYPDPEEFRPERFSEENRGAIPKMGFIPFSAGHRICLGKALATMEASLILTRFIQRLKFESVTAGPPEPQPMITLRPDPSYRLSLALR